MHSSPVGNDLSVREPWLALRAEPALEPALPVVDAHHHFYERPGWTYLPGDDLADAASGHAVVATVSMQALTRHRPAGPAALQPVGGWAAIPIPRANAAGAPPCPVWSARRASPSARSRHLQDLRCSAYCLRNWATRCWPCWPR